MFFFIVVLLCGIIALLYNMNEFPVTQTVDIAVLVVHSNHMSVSMCTLLLFLFKEHSKYSWNYRYRESVSIQRIFIVP